MNNIQLLKNNLQNSVMLFYTECFKIYGEEKAKNILSDTLRQYLNENSSNQLLIDRINNIINILMQEYKNTDNESQKLKFYEQINKLQDALSVIREVNNG